MQYSQAEKNSSVFVALINCIPAIVSLFIVPYASDIIGKANVQLVALIPSFESKLPIMWTIISVILVIVFCVMIIDTSSKLKSWFDPKPDGTGQWIATSVSFGFMLVPLFTYTYYICNLTKYFFDTFPS